jgi:hypothetical protein
LLLLTGLTQLTALALHDHRCSDSAHQRLIAAVQGLNCGVSEDGGEFDRMQLHAALYAAAPYGVWAGAVECGGGGGTAQHGLFAQLTDLLLFDPSVAVNKLALTIL